MTLHRDCKAVAIGAEEIAARVKDAAAWLDERFAGCAVPPVAVCNLKGSVMFFCDLVRAMRTDVELEFMAVGSYGSAMSAVGRPKIRKHLFSSIAGRDVILVEDIVDTGCTLVTLRKFLAERGAKSVTAVAMLDKPARRKVDAAADFTCFTVEDEFLVGYGMDYAERYRDLPYFALLKDEIVAQAKGNKA